jgi:DNA mismatch repair protein MutS2
MIIESEIDLHRLTTDEAIAELDRYLYDAFKRRFSYVLINHGKGTGALRQAVHRELKRNSVVKSYRLGRSGEGGVGVTIVQITDK